VKLLCLNLNFNDVDRTCDRKLVKELLINNITETITWFETRFS